MARRCECKSQYAIFQDGKTFLDSVQRSSTESAYNRIEFLEKRVSELESCIRELKEKIEK